MLLLEHIQLRLADLGNALADAVANPLPGPTVPTPPLDDETMRDLTARRPDLAKLITDRTAVLQQRAAEAAAAQDGLRQIYSDALSRIAAVIKGGGEPPKPRPPRPVPFPVIKR
jgi:hypothetical protein